MLAVAEALRTHLDYSAHPLIGPLFTFLGLSTKEGASKI